MEEIWPTYSERVQKSKLAIVDGRKKKKQKLWATKELEDEKRSSG